MEQKELDTVHGYVRLNFGESYPKDIATIIYEFYLLRFDSKTLTNEEQTSLLDLLYKQLRRQEENVNMKAIGAKLLYRASEHRYSASKFHELCVNKGATIALFHTEYNHIFGAYLSVPYERNTEMSVTDSNAFLFSLRPELTISKLRHFVDRPRGEYAFTFSSHMGPIYGGAADIWIFDKCNTRQNGCQSTDESTFIFDPKTFTGSNGGDAGRNRFKVDEYEVFAISVSK